MWVVIQRGGCGVTFIRHHSLGVSVLEAESLPTLSNFSLNLYTCQGAKKKEGKITSF